MTNTRLHKPIQASKLKQLYKSTSLFAIALVLGVTSLTVLITPQANATTLPNVVADPGFNVGGSGFTSSESRQGQCADTFIEQPDGKLIVAGGFTAYNGQTKNKIIRLNTDGSIDNTFNNGGSGFDLGNWKVIRKLILQDDGKIIAAGYFNSYNGQTKEYIIRLNTDGTIDNTFNSGGSGFDWTIDSLLLLNNNKILAMGGLLLCSGVYTPGFSIVNGLNYSNLVLLNSNGSVDTSFQIGTGFDKNVHTAVQTIDNKLLVGGEFTTYNGASYNKIIRLNMDGSVDNTFSHGGVGFGNANWHTVHVIKALPDGKFLVGGDIQSFNGVSQNRLIRLNPDGSKDTSFDIGDGFNAAVNDIILQSDGKLIAAGDFTIFNGSSQNRLIRLNPDGSKDTNFDIGSGFENRVRDISLSTDNKLLIVGSFSTYNANPVSKYFTRLQITPDRDQDGLEDSIEDTVSNNGDANNDGVLDSNQNNVSSFINPITNKTSSIQVDPTCTLSSLSTKEESNQNNQDDTYSYPLGLYDFTANCGTPGYTTQVKLYNYDTPNTSSYITRKYNPNTKLYSDLIGSYLEDITINNQTVKVSNYSLTDGSDNDTDGLTNGIIVDPVGLATITTTTTNTTPMAPNTGVEMKLVNIYVNLLQLIVVMFITIAVIASSKLFIYHIKK